MTYDETKQAFAAMCEVYSEIQRLRRSEGVVFNPAATSMLSEAIGMIEDTYPDVSAQLAQEMGQVCNPSYLSNLDMY